MRAAATDPQIKAVIGIAGGYNSPSHFADQMRTAAYRRVLGTFLARYDEELPVVASGGSLWPATNRTPITAPPDRRHRVGEPGHERVAAVPRMTFDALGATPLIGATPLPIVHGEVQACCASACLRTVRARYGTKEVHWLDAGQHIDLDHR
jgi:hypothetical protein